MNTLAENRNAVTELEKLLLVAPQIEIPLKHFFAPDIYLRQVVMPAGAVVIGHQHLTEHFNIVLTGRATVCVDGKTEEIKAPCVFVSGAGVRKALIIHEEMTWLTVHHTNEKDEEKRDAALIKKSAAFLELENKNKNLTKEIYGMGCSRNGGGWCSSLTSYKERFGRWWRRRSYRRISANADTSTRAL